MCCLWTTGSPPSTRRPPEPTTPMPRFSGHSSMPMSWAPTPAGWPSAATAREATSQRWCRCGRATKAHGCPRCSCCSTRHQLPGRDPVADVVRRRVLPHQAGHARGAGRSSSTARRSTRRPAGVAAAGRRPLGLPPTLLLTAGFDPLRDEGRQYAEALARGRGTVDFREFGSLVHGFANFFPLGEAAARPRWPKRSLRCAPIWPARENPPVGRRYSCPVATKPKKQASYDLKAADRKRNLAIQIGLTSFVVIFAVALVLYIVMSGDKKPASGRGQVDPGRVEQRDQEGRQLRPEGRAVALRRLPVPALRPVRAAVRADGEQAHRHRCRRRRLLHGCHPGQAGQRLFVAGRKRRVLRGRRIQ
jgi:hypothetical protein